MLALFKIETPFLKQKEYFVSLINCISEAFYNIIGCFVKLSYGCKTPKTIDKLPIVC